MEIMALQTGFPSVFFNELRVGGLRTVKADFEVLVAIPAKSVLYASDPFSVVLSMAVVAFMGPQRAPLFCKPGFHEPGNWMTVVGAVVTPYAGLVVHRSKANGNPIMAVQAHQSLGVVSHLLSERAWGFLVAGFAFQILMGRVHGAQSLEALGWRYPPHPPKDYANEHGDRHYLRSAAFDRSQHSF